MLPIPWSVKFEASVRRGTKLYINNPGHMTKMAAMPIYGKNPLKNLLLRNRWTDFNETCLEALLAKILQCIYNSCPCDDLDLFLQKDQLGSTMPLHGEDC